MSPLSLILSAAWLMPAAELQVKPTDWPQFRGIDRTAVSKEGGLLKEWPENGPKKVYSVSGLGGGYSTVSVVGGFIFGTGKRGDQEVLFALKEEDGSEVWALSFADAKRVSYGEGPRSTPTYHKGKVYAIGVGGDLICADAESGKKVWAKNFVRDFGGKMMSGWGYSESVLVDGDKLICTPGAATAAVVALNPETGETIWKSAIRNPGGAGYAAPMKTQVGNMPMYITLLGKSGGLVGVHADTGKLLWQYTRIVNGTANIPTSIVRGDMVFASTGYGDGGAALLKLKPKGDVIEVEELKYYSSRELQNHHGGMVLLGNHIYLGRGHNNGLPTCVEFSTGKIAWAEDYGAGQGNGSAAIAAADNMIYLRYQNGTMALIKANPREYEFVSAFKLPEPSGKPSWPHPTIANGKLFIRDQDKLHVFDLKSK